MRILLVDDHTLFREGLASLLQAQPDISFVGMTGSFQEAVEIASREHPDIVLTDFVLQDGTGLDVGRRILKLYPETRVVFLTVFDEDEKLFAALRIGAKGYLLKNVSVTNLLGYLRGVYRGEAALTPAMTSRVLTRFTKLSRPALPPVSRRIKGLTARELEVLREVCVGATNRAIADRLCISERTVKNHMSNIFAKLDLKNRRAAAHQARSLGWFDDS